MSKIRLGCIADDFTGATDLASNLVGSGMRVLQTIGVPSQDLDEDVDAVVVALKSRTIAPQEAVALSIQALKWLQAQGAEQIYFKYCSTFDSTPEGNIGCVTDALMRELGINFTIATPAFPAGGRMVFKGHLFVGDVLLADSGMKDHPLTPMKDSNLVRVLQAQTQRKVGLIDYSAVGDSSESITKKIQQMKEQGAEIAIVDALNNADLMRLGIALKDMKLVTAGSGVSIGLAQNFGIAPSNQAALLPKAKGRKAIVSGSCSSMTNAQVKHFIEAGGAAYAIDPIAISKNEDVVENALAWANQQNKDAPVLIYATAEPVQVKQIQAKLGVARAGEMVEKTLSAIALGLVKQGVAQLIVAGGETSGACVQALGITSLRIGQAFAPGVPWTYAQTLQYGLHLSLKSGNFGAVDCFTSAFKILE